MSPMELPDVGAGKTALERAHILLSAKVEWKPLAKDFLQMAARAPIRGVDAMKIAVLWWEGQAKPRIPVRASVTGKQRRQGMKGPLYRRVGRGMLRKSTRSFVSRGGQFMAGGAHATAGTIVGGLLSGTHYAIWLAAGTRTIAGGAVMRWKHGDPLITDWPAKRLAQAQGTAGGNYDAAMPILLPWLPEAQERLVREFNRLMWGGR